MKEGDDTSRGVSRLAFAALQDRDFFERLLRDPRSAAEEKREELDLTDDEIDQAVELVNETREQRTVDDLLAAWDDHAMRIAIWPEDLEIWPERVEIWPNHD